MAVFSPDGWVWNKVRPVAWLWELWEERRLRFCDGWAGAGLGTEDGDGDSAHWEKML
jgi:hypothetical protein